MIELYRKTGESEALVVSLSDEGATLERALMGADEISVSFTTSEPLEIRVGDYTRLEGDVYTLNREPNLVKASAVEYRYDLVLESSAYNLMDKLYTSALQEQGRFSLTGKLEDFVDLLLANINRDEFDPGWRKAVDGNGKSLIVETELKNLSFDGESCHDVLSRLANEFTVEYVIKGRTIAFFERAETVRDLVFEQGCGKGLYTLQRQNVDTDNTVTRAYVYGSTENLPLRYREGQGVFNRLSPREKGTDEYIPYFEERGEYPKIVEREVYFDDVKPSFTGRVETVGGEFNVVVTCGAIDFDLKTVAIGQEARVNFLTGDLMGMAFKFGYDHAGRRLTLVRQENEMAMAGADEKRPLVPDGTRKAMIGDKFTFTGINLPDAYVRTAEALLAEKGRKWMSVHSCLRVKYNLDLDYRYARERGIELSPGDVVKIVVPGMEGEQKLRVTSVKKELKTGKQSCEVSNYLPESWEDTMEAKIQNARSSVELNRGEMLYNINATKEWTNRHFGRLAEKMVDGKAIVWDADDWQIKTVEKVPDSELWDGHRFDDYLNQAVKTDSDVEFKSVTAKALTEESYPDNKEGVSTHLVEIGEPISGTLGNLYNVDEGVNTAVSGAMLVKEDDFYVAKEPVASVISDLSHLIVPVFDVLKMKWMYIPVSSIGGVTPPPSGSGYPYVFPLVLS